MDANGNNLEIQGIQKDVYKRTLDVRPIKLIIEDLLSRYFKLWRNTLSYEIIDGCIWVTHKNGRMSLLFGSFNFKTYESLVGCLFDISFNGLDASVRALFSEELSISDVKKDTMDTDKNIWTTEDPLHPYNLFKQIEVLIKRIEEIEKGNIGNKPKDVQEVIEYLKELNIANPEANGEAFYNHYESIGWVKGKSKIKKWKSCVKTWKMPKNADPISNEPTHNNNENYKNLWG